jgi:hypothetical protein
MGTAVGAPALVEGEHVLEEVAGLDHGIDLAGEQGDPVLDDGTPGPRRRRRPGHHLGDLVQRHQA